MLGIKLMVELTKAQRRSIVEDVPIDGFTIVDIWGVDLGEDGHGQHVYLAVIRRESTGQLYGVPWASAWYGDTTIGNYREEQINQVAPIVPLWAKTKTVTVYEGPGKSLHDLDLQL